MKRAGKRELKQRIDLTIRPEIRQKADVLAREQYHSISSLVESLIAAEYERTRRHKPPAGSI